MCTHVVCQSTHCMYQSTHCMYQSTHCHTSHGFMYATKSCASTGIQSTINCNFTILND